MVHRPSGRFPRRFKSTTVPFSPTMYVCVLPQMVQVHPCRSGIEQHHAEVFRYDACRVHVCDVVKHVHPVDPAYAEPRVFLVYRSTTVPQRFSPPSSPCLSPTCCTHPSPAQLHRPPFAHITNFSAFRLRAFVGSCRRDRHNILRPETLESLYYLYWITREEVYRDQAWAIFEAFEEHCRVDRGGYAGLEDVTDVSILPRSDSRSIFLVCEQQLVLAKGIECPLTTKNHGSTEAAENPQHARPNWLENEQPPRSPP